MARRKKIEMPKPELNITSMMDLVLNLLTFFVLVSNFAAAELPPMEPPNPEHSKLPSPREAANAVTVNILPFYNEHGLANGDGLCSGIKFGATEQYAAGYSDQLREALAKEVRKSKDVQINIRADRTLRYDQISPVMRAIKEAGVTNINVVAQLTD